MFSLSIVNDSPPFLVSVAVAIGWTDAMKHGTSRDATPLAYTDGRTLWLLTPPYSFTTPFPDIYNRLENVFLYYLVYCLTDDTVVPQASVFCFSLLSIRLSRFSSLLLVTIFWFCLHVEYLFSFRFFLSVSPHRDAPFSPLVAFPVLRSALSIAFVPRVAQAKDSPL